MSGRAGTAGLAAVLMLLVAAAAGADRTGPLPAPQIGKLENGLRVAVFPDPRLPIVQLSLLVPAGIADEPAEQAGVAQLTAQALPAGSSSRTAAAFTEDLERLGGSLGVAVGRDYASVSGTFLARDLDAGLELLADAVIHPVFPPGELERLRRQIAGGLMQAQQSAAAVAEEQVWSLAFREHPYGRALSGTLESLPSLTPDQLRAFHRDHYRPDRAVLAIAGDVTPERALAAAHEWFSSWAGRARTAAVPEPAWGTAGPRFVVVDVPDHDRAEIRLGIPSAPRDAPDYLALALANHCFGGASWSRLARAGPGAGGDARSSITPLRTTGLLVIAASCPPESVRAVIDRLRDRLRDWLAQPPDEAELERARRYFRGFLPLQLETLAARAAQWLAADFYGLPQDFFDRYDERIAAIGPADAAAAVRRWIDPSRLAVLVVGPARRLRVFESPGRVEVQAAPPAVGAAAGAKESPAPGPEDERRGREAFQQALTAHGGEERLGKIADSTVEGELVLLRGGDQVKGTMRQLRKEPERMVYVTDLQGFESRQTLDRGRAWSQAAEDTSNVVEADSLQAAGLEAIFRSDLPHLLLAGVLPGAHPIYQGRGRIGDRDAEVVRLDSPGGGPRRFYFDAGNHQLLAIDEPALPGMGRLLRRLYGDYRSVDGVLWPMSEERQIDGNRVTQLTLKKVALNSGLPDRLFEPPATSRRAH